MYLTRRRCAAVLALVAALIVPLMAVLRADDQGSLLEAEANLREHMSVLAQENGWREALVEDCQIRVAWDMENDICSYPSKPVGWSAVLSMREIARTSVSTARSGKTKYGFYFDERTSEAIKAANVLAGWGEPSVSPLRRRSEDFAPGRQ